MNKRQKKKALKKRLMSINMKFMPLITRNHRIYDLNRMADAFDRMLTNGRARVTTSDVDPQIVVTIKPEDLPKDLLDKNLRPSFSIRSLGKIPNNTIDRIISYSPITPLDGRMMQYTVLKEDEFVPRMKESLKTMSLDTKILIDSFSFLSGDSDHPNEDN